MLEADMEEKDIKSVVREKYGNIAATSGSCCSAASCCGDGFLSFRWGSGLAIQKTN